MRARELMVWEAGWYLVQLGAGWPRLGRIRRVDDRIREWLDGMHCLHYIIVHDSYLNAIQIAILVRKVQPRDT
jgi:hypothetical protein